MECTPERGFDETCDGLAASPMNIDSRPIPKILFIYSGINLHEHRSGRMNPCQMAGRFDSVGVVGDVT